MSFGRKYKVFHCFLSFLKNHYLIFFFSSHCCLKCRSRDHFPRFCISLFCVSNIILICLFHEIIFFFFWLHCSVCGILVPGQGIEPTPLALKAWSLNHWTTRKFSRIFYINKYPNKGNIRASLMAQMVKNLPAMWETWV